MADVTTALDDRTRRRSLEHRLASLYASESGPERARAYLASHAHANSIARQVDVFEWYRPYLPASGVILDWGCQHAPDACMIREVLGDSVEIHGCDFVEPGFYPGFHGFAGLHFQHLDDPVRLPYRSWMFDAVIASGVLEHTMMDYESLKELHRVLKPGGLLAISFLPNRLSLSEWVARRRGLTCHLRLYGRGEAHRMLLHHGFQPIESRYHQLIPAHRGQSIFGGLWRFNALLERAWPICYLCANVAIVARARTEM